jgi:hypothetical protein
MGFENKSPVDPAGAEERGMKSKVLGGLALLTLGACTSVGIPIAPVATPASSKQSNLEVVEVQRIENSPTAGSILVRVENSADHPILLGVDLRAEPGMWLAPVRQDTRLFYLPPGGERTVSMEYAFGPTSPEAALRVRVGVPEEHADGWIHVPEPVAVRRFYMGTAAAAASFLDRFDRRATADLMVYAVRDMFLPEALDDLVAVRAHAITELSRILAVRPPPGIRIVFYPDADSKTADTHHVGAGMTKGTTIVEIFNDSVQLDPYHELAHVMAGQLGWAPAWLNEGFAVFASEHLGADALAHLGSPGKTVDQASCEFHRSGELIPVAELMRLPDIGPDGTRPKVTYAQAASFTRFLAKEFGLEALRRAYRTLSAMASDDENQTAFAQAFGVSSEEASERWFERLASTCH